MDTPDQKHLDRILNITFHPVFIVGDHRSGTTLLYQLLADTGCFHVVTAYHVIEYDEILNNHLNGSQDRAKSELAERFIRLGLTDRIIDGVRVTPDLPEEYGFIIDPENNRPQLTPATLPRFVEMCRKIEFAAGDSKPLLLKNPWDVLRFREIHESFPEARFIFIHRHPEAIINSQVRAIRSSLEKKNDYIALIAPWYRKLFRQPLRLAVAKILFSSKWPFWKRMTPRHICKVADYYLANIGAVPKAKYISVRYEDLCTDPDEAIGGILRFLEVEPKSVASYRDFIEPRAPKILPEVQENFRTIRSRLAPFLRHHRYE